MMCMPWPIRPAGYWHSIFESAWTGHVTTSVIGPWKRLTPRCGLWTEDDFRQSLALEAANERVKDAGVSLVEYTDVGRDGSRHPNGAGCPQNLPHAYRSRLQPAN